MQQWRVERTFCHPGQSFGIYIGGGHPIKKLVLKDKSGAIQIKEVAWRIHKSLQTTACRTDQPIQYSAK